MRTKRRSDRGGHIAPRPLLLGTGCGDVTWWADISTTAWRQSGGSAWVPTLMTTEKCCACYEQLGRSGSPGGHMAASTPLFGVGPATLDRRRRAPRVGTPAAEKQPPSESCAAGKKGIVRAEVTSGAT
ncbi:hypothetical protein MTO96_009765 [Rhipicephalus appendiculatus]